MSMRGTTKIAVLLSLTLLPALARPGLAGGVKQVNLPNTGINTDCPFPIGVDPICGIQITVHGSKPVNFYTGTRMPAAWLPPAIVENPVGSGDWTITFGNTGPGSCISRSDPRWWECGVFKGVHFGFYTDDPIVNLLDPNSSNWSHQGPPCVYFNSSGEAVPCTGLTSHAAHGFGEIAILNENVSASASSAVLAKAQATAQGLSIQNVQVAVAPGIVAINDLGPCALRNLQWRNLALADSKLPATTAESGIGTLTVPIPDDILGEKGWGVLSYDVVDPATGNILTRSTLDFPLNP